MERRSEWIARCLAVGVCMGTGACQTEATDLGSGRSAEDGALGEDADPGAGGEGGGGGPSLDLGAGGDAGVGGAGGLGGEGGAGGRLDADVGDASGQGDAGGAGGAGDAAGGAGGGAGGEGGAGGPTVFEDPEHPCVTVADLGGLLMFAYEASRPDATANAAGSAPGACSRPGVLPAATVTLAESEAACAAVDYHLCTDAEWRRACVGPSGTRGWPYGDVHQAGRCNEHVSGEGHLLRTGAKAGCVSPEGVHDLSGNLWERTADETGLGDGFKRGGSYKLNAVMFRTAVTGCNEPFDLFGDLADEDIGFRCCR
jgi:hypothetical protein